MLKLKNNPDILSKKPDLKLKSNHYTYISGHGRVWDSLQYGPAIRDGKGWYKHK